MDDPIQKREYMKKKIKGAYLYYLKWYINSMISYEDLLIL